MAKAIVGIIGGSGVYDLDGPDRRPRGARRDARGASPPTLCASAASAATEAVFLARHGQGHRFAVLDDQLSRQYRRAEAGRRHRHHRGLGLRLVPRELYPGLFVLVDQFERPHLRAPDELLRHRLRRPCADGPSDRAAAARAHRRRRRRRGHRLPVSAEPISAWRGRNSRRSPNRCVYQARGADVIGMTAATEAKLAREAEISYATIAMVTDYDCWHEEHGAGRRRLGHEGRPTKTPSAVDALVARVLARFPAEHEPCPVGSDRALDGAIMTHPSARDPDARRQARRGRWTRASRGA